MSIPVWLPWTVAAAFVLTASFAQANRRVDKQPVHLEFLGRTWSAALVALVVAGVLTYDLVRIGEEELYDAADRATAELEGSSTENTELLQFLVEDQLGREVYMDNVEPTRPPEEGETPHSYELRPSEDSDTAVCVKFTQSTSSGPGLGWPIQVWRGLSRESHLGDVSRGCVWPRCAAAAIHT